MRRALPPAGLSALVAVAVLVWAILPQLLPRHTNDLLVFTGIFSIAGLGIGLLLGHCGIVNLAQGLFYALGAYASAYCTVTLGWPSITGFIVGMVLAALVAFLLGWPILRLTGYFLALATLALGIIGSALFFEWDGITGGSLGIGGIPKIEILGFAFDSPARMYYLVWGAAFACMWLAHNLVASRTGLMLRAMRDSGLAAASLAIDLAWLRTRVFVLCAVLGALAGSLFAHHVSFVSTESFTVTRSIVFLLIPVLGGVTSIPGVVLGSLFVTCLPELLSRFGDIHQVLFGLALVGVVAVLPGGLAGALVSLWQRLAPRRAADA